MRAALNISVPPDMRTWVEEQVKRRGYGTASEFVRHVLRREQQRELRGDIDQNLLEALDSGEPTPMTKKDWDDIRREGRRRLAKRTKKAR
jgi:antitoxin ParD1/3/4